MKATRLVGIVGGISHIATLEYYRLIFEECRNSRPGDDLPEVIVYSLAFDRFRELENSCASAEYIGYIGKAVTALQKAGAQCIALAANSPHSVIDELISRFGDCFISVLGSSYSGASRLGIRKGLLLGNRYTMQATYYKQYFLDRGIELIAPSLPDQVLVDSLISRFIPGETSGKETLKMITDLIVKYPADGVILGCMRLPLVFKEGVQRGLKIVNPLELHVRDIVSYIYTDN